MEPSPEKMRVAANRIRDAAGKSILPKKQERASVIPIKIWNPSLKGPILVWAAEILSP